MKLDASKLVDKAQLKIGNQTITLSADEADKATPVVAGTEGKVYIGDLTDAEGNFDMDKFTERLSQATAHNTVWTVSAKADKDGITLVERTDETGAPTGNTAAKALDALKDKNLDLTSEAGIKATLGLVTPGTEAVEGKEGKALTLQIGDTSDPFNQLNVVVGDMHVNAMGKMNTDEKTGAPDGVAVDKNGKALSIENIDISTREGASDAIDVIKAAINYVSGIRGDLGATQNRLEHTANNLSVMAENIQDAESTIRDTDVAEEMMAYTKNNILIQSAQAMLAQANAVPQGVLQLLG